jgi:nucleoside-diphosphate-sugar epimerase
MKIIITGASGFIGSVVTERLVGEDISALVRKTSNSSGLRKNTIPLIEGDILDAEGLTRCFTGFDTVVHCAGFVTDWGRKEDFIINNFNGTQNVLNACQESGAKRLIYLSTVDIFGHKNHSLINEFSRLAVPAGWYGKSKVMAEKIVRDAMNKKLLDISIVYPPWVFGKDDRRFIPEIIHALKKKEMLFFRNRGKHTIELCHIDNLAEAIHVILKTKESIGKGFIICDDPKIDFRHFVNKIALELGIPDCRASLPYSVTCSIAFIMETFYKLLRIQTRPLLTLHAVSLLGNDIRYSNEAIKQLGYKQKVNFNECSTEIVQQALKYIN